MVVTRRWRTVLSGKGSDRPRIDGQDSELAAEELPFEVHRARFGPVSSILREPLSVDFAYRTLQGSDACNHKDQNPSSGEHPAQAPLDCDSRCRQG
jgi:hypothetical protein